MHTADLLALLVYGVGYTSRILMLRLNVARLAPVWLYGSSEPAARAKALNRDGWVIVTRGGRENLTHRSNASRGTDPRPVELSDQTLMQAVEHGVIPSRYTDSLPQARQENGLYSTADPSANAAALLIYTVLATMTALRSGTMSTTLQSIPDAQYNICPPLLEALDLRIGLVNKVDIDGGRVSHDSRQYAAKYTITADFRDTRRGDAVARPVDNLDRDAISSAVRTLRRLDTARFSTARFQMYVEPLAEFFASHNEARGTWEELVGLEIVEVTESLQSDWNNWPFKPQWDWGDVYHTQAFSQDADDPVQDPGDDWGDTDSNDADDALDLASEFSYASAHDGSQFGHEYDQPHRALGHLNESLTGNGQFDPRSLRRGDPIGDP